MNTDLNIRPEDAERTTALVVGTRTGEVAHRDIGLIAPTEADGITINRTKERISPFVPIVKVPTHSSYTGNLAGYAVEIEDPSEKSGFRVVGNVSANYLLLTNEEVRELALEVAQRSGLPFRESRIFWDGARFAHIIDFLGVEEDVCEGDGVGLSLVTRSSYDRSWRFETALMGKRFACDNGALSGEFFARVAFKHTQGESREADWKDVVRAGLSVVNRAPESLGRFATALRELKEVKMTDEQLRRVWKLAPSIGDGIKGKIMARYVEHEEATLYGFFNAGTNVFWHNEKMTAADYANNDAFTSGLLRYTQEQRN